MRIRAILRFRNEDLTRKRLIAGFKRQEDLADVLGVSATTVSTWETFRAYPQKMEIIEALLFALDCEYEEIFPPEFVRAVRKKIGVPLERVIDVKQLPRYTRGEFLLPSPEKACELKEIENTIEEAFKMITEREAEVLRMRFGLGGRREHSLEEAGEQLKVGKERIRQIEAKALRKLKHPTRNRRLRGFI